MIDVAPAQLALRVGIFAGALGVVGLFPGELRLMAAGVLGIIALVFLYEIWAARGSRRAQRDAAIWAGLAAVGVVVLVEGWAAMVATPLLVLAGVCIALWFVATLGTGGGGDSESETLH